MPLTITSSALNAPWSSFDLVGFVECRLVVIPVLGRLGPRSPDFGCSLGFFCGSPSRILNSTATLAEGHYPSSNSEVPEVTQIIVLIGLLLELKARDRTGNAIQELICLSPQIGRSAMRAGDEGLLLSAVWDGDRLFVSRDGSGAVNDGFNGALAGSDLGGRRSKPSSLPVWP